MHVWKCRILSFSLIIIFTYFVLTDKTLRNTVTYLHSSLIRLKGKCISDTPLRLLALYRETKALNKPIQRPPCLPVQYRDTSLCSLSKTQDDGREQGFSCWLFCKNSVTISQYVKAEESSQTKSRHLQRGVGGTLPKGQFMQQKWAYKVLARGSVLERLGLRTLSDASISGWNTICEVNSRYLMKLFFSMKWDQNEVHEKGKWFLYWLQGRVACAPLRHHFEHWKLKNVGQTSFTVPPPPPFSVFWAKMRCSNAALMTSYSCVFPSPPPLWSKTKYLLQNSHTKKLKQ